MVIRSTLISERRGGRIRGRYQSLQKVERDERDRLLFSFCVQRVRLGDGWELMRSSRGVGVWVSVQNEAGLASNWNKLLAYTHPTSSSFSIESRDPATSTLQLVIANKQNPI